MILDLGSFKIDLSSPKTAFFLVTILFILMVISAYCSQKEKKFVRTKSGRLTTKQPTRKVKAPKTKTTQSSSLLPKKVKKKIIKKSNKLRKKGEKTLKSNKKGSLMSDSFDSQMSDLSEFSHYSDY